ncbi:Kil protein [Flyfo siphovirus Tbat2_3]|nr:Kil protein [Flyfo siphovirus Tbat2_3]
MQQINHQALRAAQAKVAIAEFIGDGRMWQEAHQDIKRAIKHPWYRRRKGNEHRILM